MSEQRGCVYLVGAGPGDAGLLTRRGEEVLRDADCVVYDGLVSAEVVALSSASAERVYAGKKRMRGKSPLTQDEINALLIERAAKGQRVVRLKGGDPFVFGRGAEEARALADSATPFEIVPGVTAATAVSAYAGIPLTARGLASTVTLVAGHEAEGKNTSDVDWGAVAKSQTVVLFMAWTNLATCIARLIDSGRDPKTPAAAIYWGTTGAQRTVDGTLESLEESCESAQLRPPVLVVIGDVVSQRQWLSWYEGRALGGKRVLVTRSGRDSELLCRAVRGIGGEPIPFPLTEIQRAESTQEIDEALSCLRDGRYEWLVFSSANAVDSFFEHLWQRGGDCRWLASSRCAAVGGNTAAAMQSKGVRADLVPTRGNAVSLASSLVAAGAGGTRVLFPRAEHGREELIAELRSAGARVDPLSVYRTAIRDPADDLIADGLHRLRSHEIDIVLLFSPSQVRALAALLATEASELLSRVGVFGVIGSTTQAALTDLGIVADVVASQPDAETLLAEVAAAVTKGS